MIEDIIIASYTLLRLLQLRIINGGNIIILIIMCLYYFHELLDQGLNNLTVCLYYNAY